MNALPALGNAHVAVNKAFDFDTGLHFEQLHLRQTKFAADHHARDAEFLQSFNGGGVVDIHHDRRVHWQVETVIANAFDDRKILNQHGIGLDVGKEFQIIFERGQFLGADEIIDRDVKFDAALMSVVDRADQFFIVEIKIISVDAHIEMLAAEINRVRSRVDCCNESVPRAGGRQ